MHNVSVFNSWVLRVLKQVNQQALDFHSFVEPSFGIFELSREAMELSLQQLVWLGGNECLRPKCMPHLVVYMLDEKGAWPHDFHFTARNGSYRSNEAHLHTLCHSSFLIASLFSRNTGLPRLCMVGTAWKISLTVNGHSCLVKYHVCLVSGLRALTACLRIPDWPRRLVSNFARITAGLGGPKIQLAHLIGSHQWEMPSCTGFLGFAWGLITSQLRRAAISTCLGPVVSATCAILMH